METGLIDNVSNPNPGSQEAIKVGCTCPVMDNAGGRGIDFGGEILFWMNSLCPIHGEP